MHPPTLARPEDIKIEIEAMIGHEKGTVGINITVVVVVGGGGGGGGMYASFHDYDALYF
jgi:hypothetical protein